MGTRSKTSAHRFLCRAVSLFLHRFYSVDRHSHVFRCLLLGHALRAQQPQLIVEPLLKGQLWQGHVQQVVYGDAQEQGN